MEKSMVDIGGGVWVDVASILIVQPRTQDGDGVRHIPGCTVFLAGKEDPVYGTDPPAEVISNMARAI